VDEHASRVCYVSCVRALAIGLVSASALFAAAACMSLSGLSETPAADGGGLTDATSVIPDAPGEAASGDPDAPSGCPVGKGDCDGNPTNGCETDLTSSPTDCGACKHDCKGQACTASACTPLIVAQGRDSPRSLAVGIAVAWIEGPQASASIMASSGTTLLTIAGGQNDPTDLAVDGATVYWPVKGDGKVLACDIPCVGSPKTLWTAPPGATASAVAFDTTTLYWMAPGFSGGAMLSTPKGTPVADGGGRALGTFLSIGADTIASGNSNVWYADTRDGGTLRGLAKGIAGGATNALDGLGALGAFYNNGGVIYFVTSGPAGSVRACDVPTCANPPVYAVAQANPVDVVSDGASVYWATQGLGASDGAIWKCPRTGTCTPQKMAGGQGKPSSIDLDATYVYWTNAGDGAIRKTPK